MSKIATLPSKLERVDVKRTSGVELMSLSLFTGACGTQWNKPRLGVEIMPHIRYQVPLSL